MTPTRSHQQASGRPWLAPVLLAGLALATSATFCFVVYPAAARPLHAVLDSDHYGDLGFGLLRKGTLCYYPDDQPTVERGPAYPAFLAACLFAAAGRHPQAAQAGQCLLLALMVLLIAATARRLWGGRSAWVAGAVCAVHPFLLWYTSRIWVETLAMFLFAAFLAAGVAVWQRPALWRAVLAGAVLGLCALCKATFLPLVFVAPLLLLAAGARRGLRRLAPAMFAAALLTVAPWTMRNGRLTGRFIPVHLLAGENFQIGDGMIEHYARSPWSFADLWDAGLPRRRQIVRDVPPEKPLWRQEAQRNDLYLADSLNRYGRSPGFLARKVLLNSFLFWILGQTPAKTAVIAAMQGPLVAAFILAAARAFRRGLGNTASWAAAMVILYYLLHLPVVACARYSVVLVPVMVLLAAGLAVPRSASALPAEASGCRGPCDVSSPA